MSICPACGAKIFEGSRFCTKCGRRATVAVESNENTQTIQTVNKKITSNPRKILLWCVRVIIGLVLLAFFACFIAVIVAHTPHLIPMALVSDALFLAALIALIIGLISPRTVVLWGPKERRTRARVATIYGVAALCFLITARIFVLSATSTEETQTATSSSGTSQNAATNTPNPPKPSVVPGLNLDSVSAALSAAGLNYSLFTENSSGIMTYDAQNLGIVVGVSLTNAQNMALTDPSEDAADLTVSIDPDNSHYEYIKMDYGQPAMPDQPSGQQYSPVPVFMPFTPTEIQSISAILATIAEINYSGSKPTQAYRWEYQHYDTPSTTQPLPQVQIGPASIIGQEISNPNGTPGYLLNIELSQNTTNLYQSKGGNSNNNSTNQQLATNSLPSAIPAPTITPDGGTFSGPVTISFSGHGRVEDIEYTTDGSDPTITDDWNGDPITIDQSETIKVAYFEDYDSEGNAEWSKVAEATFVINSPPAAQTESQPVN